MNHTDYNGNYVFFQDGEIIRKENWRRNKIPILTLLFFLNVIIIVGCFQISASALGDKKTNVICLVIQIICLISLQLHILKNSLRLQPEKFMLVIFIMRKRAMYLA